ncbi:hypothetical protein ABKW28_12970 [Nocardioides sp. 31GB23]|uniref:hypothetical protein n=1 Tax=Nocardioides sp. 31GB23 TaxID=3156065 RepID=UPI0032AEA871
MSADVLERPAEAALVTDIQEPDEPSVVHWVCHCTDQRVSACGRDVSGRPFEPAGTDTPDCPACAEAWPAEWTCPSGCACEECWRGAEL